MAQQLSSKYLKISSFSNSQKGLRPFAAIRPKGRKAHPATSLIRQRLVSDDEVVVILGPPLHVASSVRWILSTLGPGAPLLFDETVSDAAYTLNPNPQTLKGAPAGGGPNPSAPVFDETRLAGAHLRCADSPYGGLVRTFGKCPNP